MTEFVELTPDNRHDIKGAYGFICNRCERGRVIHFPDKKMPVVIGHLDDKDTDVHIPYPQGDIITMVLWHGMRDNCTCGRFI